MPINPYTGKEYNEGLTRVEYVTRVPVIGGWREDISQVSHEKSPQTGQAYTPTPENPLVSRQVLVNGQWVTSTESQSLGGTGASPVQFSRIGSPEIKQVPTRIERLQEEGIGIEDERTQTSRILKPTASMRGGGVLYGKDFIGLASHKEGGILGASRKDLFMKTQPQSILTSEQSFTPISPELREEGRLQRLQQEDLAQGFTEVETKISELAPMKFLKELRTTTATKDSLPRIIRKYLEKTPSASIALGGVSAPFMPEFAERYSQTMLEFPEFATNVIAKTIVTYRAAGKYALSSPVSVAKNVYSGGKRALTSYAVEVPKAFVSDPVGSVAQAAAYTTIAASFRMAVESAPSVLKGTREALGTGNSMRGTLNVDPLETLLKKKKRSMLLQQEQISPEFSPEVISGESVNQYYAELLKKKKRIAGWQMDKAFEQSIEISKKTGWELDLLKLKKKGVIFTNPELEFIVQPQATPSLVQTTYTQQIRLFPGQFQIQELKSVTSQRISQRIIQTQTSIDKLLVGQVMRQKQTLGFTQIMTTKPLQIQSQRMGQAFFQSQKQAQSLKQLLTQPQLQVQKQVQKQALPQLTTQVSRIKGFPGLFNVPSGLPKQPITPTYTRKDNEFSYYKSPRKGAKGLKQVVFKNIRALVGGSRKNVRLV